MKIDHIHFVVEDAERTGRWLTDTLGWRWIGGADPTDTVLQILEHRGSRFILSSPRSDASPLGRHLRSHGPGVVDVALAVENIDAVLQRIQRFSGMTEGSGEAPISFSPPGDGASPEACSWIPGWGSVGHTLVQRRPEDLVQLGTGIDHIVLNVKAGDLDPAVLFYRHLLAIEPCQNFGISTDRSSMRSTVLGSSDEHLYFNINEPCSSNSQIQEFILSNRGAGIQHIALRSDPLIPTMAAHRKCGLRVLPVSADYYRRLQRRLQNSAAAPILRQHEWNGICSQNILIDWQPEDPAALLLQTFSVPPFVGSQFFFEFIERRRDAKGFGQNNFQELYEAVEQELLDPCAP